MRCVRASTDRWRTEQVNYHAAPKNSLQIFFRPIPALSVRRYSTQSLRLVHRLQLRMTSETPRAGLYITGCSRALTPDQYSYPSVFLYGHRATGKSHVLLTLLSHLQVVEKAELLRDMEANLLPALLRLQELIVWEKFRPNTGCFEPLLLHFPDYTKAELLHILSRYSHPSYTPELYTSYINILLGVFYSVCRDLRELPRESDTHKLWRNMEPHLKKAMQSVYLREVSSVQWEQQQVDEKEATTLRGLSAHTHLELPYYSKFLLIAAYLASYNPARTDRRFFLKTSNHLLGPKPFPLDRLLAIFYSVVDSRVAPTASVFSQISSLVTLQLLTQMGHDDQLDSPKYRCAVSLDFILAISRKTSFWLDEKLGNAVREVGVA
ncbi:Origin recognition complex subunit 5 [Bagarius yarrelli]|uniref:Origin recognition complex subunit 5 n=1 Tax=Bagarius yarrelli TaxID=175774 RepID=A0A556VLF6_BAGYA|nr:Origin recognition complex subunit 5 [Bagarius yarrelli]